MTFKMFLIKAHGKVNEIFYKNHMLSKYKNYFISSNLFNKLLHHK